MNTIRQIEEKAEKNSVIGSVGALVLAIASLGANSLGFGPIATAIAADLRVGVAAVMLAAGGYGLSTGLGALFLSRLIDRYGVSRALTTALIVASAAFLISAAAPATLILVAAQCLAGLAAGVAIPAIYACAAQIAPKGRESVVLGRVLFGWTISLVGGVLLTTVVAGIAHWRVVFVLLALVTAAATALVNRMAIPDQENRPPMGGLGPGLSPWAAAGIPGVTPILFACVSLMTAFYGTYGYIGDHIHRVLDNPLSATGWLAVAYGVGFGLAALGDHLIDHIGARRLFPWCFAMVGAIYALLAIASEHYIVLVAVSFGWGVFNHFALNLIVSGLSAIDPARRGSILGLNSAVTYFGACIGAVAFGPLYTATDFRTVALVGACVMIGPAVFLSIRPVRAAPADAV